VPGDVQQPVVHRRPNGRPYRRAHHGNTDVVADGYSFGSAIFGANNNTNPGSDGVAYWDTNSDTDSCAHDESVGTAHNITNRFTDSIALGDTDVVPNGNSVCCAVGGAHNITNPDSDDVALWDTDSGAHIGTHGRSDCRSHRWTNVVAHGRPVCLSISCSFGLPNRLPDCEPDCNTVEFSDERPNSVAFGAANGRAHVWLRGDTRHALCVPTCAGDAVAVLWSHHPLWSRHCRHQQRVPRHVSRLHRLANLGTDSVAIGVTHSCAHRVTYGIAHRRAVCFTHRVTHSVAHSSTIGGAHVCSICVSYHGANAAHVQRHPRRPGRVLTAAGAVWEHPTLGSLVLFCARIFVPGNVQQRRMHKLANRAANPCSNDALSNILSRGCPNICADSVTRCCSNHPSNGVPDGSAHASAHHLTD
jgi:hypothetical protein